MLFDRWRRGSTGGKPEPPKEARDARQRRTNPERIVYGNWGPDDMPRSLVPKHDERKSQVFDDEIEPEWRDPDTPE